MQISTKQQAESTENTQMLIATPLKLIFQGMQNCCQEDKTKVDQECYYQIHTGIGSMNILSPFF